MDNRMRPEIIIEHDVQRTQMRLYNETFYQDSPRCDYLTFVGSRCLNGRHRVEE